MIAKKKIRLYVARRDSILTQHNRVTGIVNQRVQQFLELHNENEETEVEYRVLCHMVSMAEQWDGK